MAFARLNRTRKDAKTRDLFAETRISVKDFILPYFVIEGRNKKEPISAMPGIYRFSIDNLLKDIEEARNLGINAVLLFGIPKRKDTQGKEAYAEDGIVQRAARAIRKNIKDIVIITDVCLCAYTTHGHCGIVKNSKFKMQNAKLQSKIQNFYIDNEKTLKILSRIALTHAQAGADFVAPSAMMDGQVKVIREVLDKNGFGDVGILAYSAKYASNFYGPFREALDSAPQFGDRKSYQLDFRNSDEALREIKQDIDEGADIVLVKPALAYLDIISQAKQDFHVPVAAYNVSGEYTLLKVGAQKGIVNEREIVLEILTAIKRAGADLIITYHAKDVARWLSH